MKFSILDLVYLREGQNFKEAYDDLLESAKKAEQYGYTRYWLAEHHNSKSIGSSATQLLIYHVLSNTNHIRVGSGGVMLPNHSPYLIAEQYGTIEILYPNRLDLGLGRAPGTDVKTAKAIRRSSNFYYDFEKELKELDSYFDGSSEVDAYPAKGLKIPKYILGSSVESAHLAAKLGLPYAFASHFAPTYLEKAVKIYKEEFKPSKWLEKPYVIVGMNIFLSDSEEKAKFLATSHIQAILGLITNRHQGLLPPKEESQIWTDYIKLEKVPHFGPIAFKMNDILHREKEILSTMKGITLSGTKNSVYHKLKDLYGKIGFDEIMVTSYIYDKNEQYKSYELLSEMIRENFK